MILIFSENISYSARYVGRHLYRMGETFCVFLENDKIEFEYRIENDSILIHVSKNGTYLCEYSEIKSIWAHRSEIQVIPCSNQPKSEEELNYLAGHTITRTESVRDLLHKKKCLGKFGKLNFNKITFLSVCQELKISIPKTLITTRKEKVIEFINQCDGVIVKSLANNYYFKVSEDGENEIWQKGITRLMLESDLEKIPEIFSLSLFQEKLNKDYEIRVFFVAEKIFSQAIFSQVNSHSMIDYREGLGDIEMRQCSYKLPDEVEDKIRLLMSNLNLNIGCIDIVKTKSNEYVFLEVNPSGIFTDMMDNCDYDMHFEIAKFLSDEK